MIHQDKQGMRLHGSLFGSSAGDTYTGQSYGDDMPCMSCGGRHPIYETQQVYDVARTIVDCIVVRRFMMIGVLRSNDGRWIAACSAAEGTPAYNAFREALSHRHKRSLPPLSILGNTPRRYNHSHGGRVISEAFIRSCRVGNAPIAGKCAAPKLILHAIAHRLPRPWTMSEVLFDPAGTNRNYTAYATAPSCATCKSLLPHLLCPSKADVALNEFNGLIQQSWGASW